MRIVAQLRESTQRGSVGENRQDCAGREVDPDAANVSWIDFRLAQNSRNGLLQDFHIVMWILERPLGRQRHCTAGEAVVDHAVGVGMDGGRDLGSIADVDEDGPPGRCSEI